MIKEALTEGLHFLSRRQDSDGSFAASSSRSRHPFVAEHTYAAPFATSLILACLRECEAPEIKEAGCRFLLSQRSAAWTFSYWARGSAEATSFPYPDDLDDTFCALIALQLCSPGLVGGETLAKVTQVLTALEEAPGGPYRTWVAGPQSAERWRDVDVAVNANIGFFLSLQDIRLPAVEKLAEQALHGRLSSPYYPGEYPVAYYLARYVQGEAGAALRERLRKNQLPDGTWEGSTLFTALAVTSLRRLGLPAAQLKNACDHLIATQKNGGWEAEGFCLDPARNGQAYYGGSAALTTAFCLEALSLCQPPARVRRAKAPAMPSQVPDRLKLFTDVNINDILGEKNLGEVLALPALISQVLPVPPSQPFLEEVLAATLYGWLAYTLYDDFLDEGGEKRLLPVANLAQREMNRIFLTLLPGTGFPGLASDILDRIDAANVWEATACRCHPQTPLGDLTLPDFDGTARLADRSMGHALAPVAILIQAGYASDSPEVAAMLSFFEHYLAARQLDDEAHDWKEDLLNGQLNAVASRLLAEALPSLDPRLPLSGPEVVETLEDLFWKKDIVPICQEVLDTVATARTYLTATRLDSRPLERLLLPVEKAARLALDEHRRAREFVAAYGTDA